jgi:hypothetical protein
MRLGKKRHNKLLAKWSVAKHAWRTSEHPPTACVLSVRAMDRCRQWTSATSRSTMGRHGLLGPTSRFPACLPRLTLAVLRPPSRCPLLELTDALLTAASVPSPPHLSLAAVHRRGWGSLYAARSAWDSMGRIDAGRLRDVLCVHPLKDRRTGDPLIYAVGTSRCGRDATPRPQQDPPAIARSPNLCVHLMASVANFLLFGNLFPTAGLSL